MNVEEAEHESDDESTMQRVDEASDATSAMMRVEESEATSIVRGDDESESEMMQRVEDDNDDMKNRSDPSMVPKELRQLGRAQASTADLKVGSLGNHSSLETQMRSTNNMTTMNQL